ncbi:endonuclease domain-containing protein [Brevundimonas sp. PAMC22021]|uniref:endonuclease domain-containing protein n=1 Tax=Brevundimonas sp. PAMC22021 TaxID=2861285 RepID=UPI001C63AC50|nr:endonuclease domain-containing protein [Brevundimonas sp. PAMC22021]QYF86047.1 endonuclease domain-containing protein [Brevundimonas sp. PAMC22021]
MEAPARTIARAKDLRRALTLPEVLLWQAIRGRRLDGVRFRRQHPFGPFIVDFYCSDARLVLEIDGSSHENPNQARHDLRRDAWLAAQGISVVRIPAREVLSDLPGVLDFIRLRAAGPPPPR